MKYYLCLLASQKKPAHLWKGATVMSCVILSKVKKMCQNYVLFLMDKINVL